MTDSKKIAWFAAENHKLKMLHEMIGHFVDAKLTSDKDDKFDYELIRPSGEKVSKIITKEEVMKIRSEIKAKEFGHHYEASPSSLSEYADLDAEKARKLSETFVDVVKSPFIIDSLTGVDTPCADIKLPLGDRHISVLEMNKLRNEPVDTELVAYLQTFAPFTFKVLVSPQPKCEFCDVCGRRDHLLVWTSGKNQKDVHFCLSGRCGQAVLGDTAWNNALFFKSSSIFGDKPVMEVKFEETIIKCEKYVRADLAPPIVASIYTFYREKGYLSDKQHKVLLNFLKDR